VRADARHMALPHPSNGLLMLCSVATEARSWSPADADGASLDSLSDSPAPRQRIEALYAALLRDFESHTDSEEFGHAPHHAVAGQASGAHTPPHRIDFMQRTPAPLQHNTYGPSKGRRGRPPIYHFPKEGEYFKCPMCGLKTKRRSNLQRHKLRAHPDAADWGP
jgi:hypothetical protein